MGKIWSFLVSLLGLVLLGYSPGVARVSGVCSNCHTMHYSQGGTTLSQWGSSGPYKALLNNNCLGCHTGINTGTNKVPYVLSTSAPTYSDTGTEPGTNTLAGGNFYWVGVDDACGHNVAGVAGVDATLGTTPPGGTDLGQQLTCAGQYGCHGDRTVAGDVEALLGAHHADDSTIDGSTVGKSYRFLKGIVGLEDSDWEYQPTSSAHNQYKGRDRVSETDIDSTTISSLCGQCHGDFHAGANISSGSWGSPWLRHPTDYDLGNTSAGSEYRNYPGNYGPAAGAYSVIAPVASEDVSSVKQTVTFNNDTIVTCISCHRAHGTPYKKILRWNYQGWPGGTTVNGCNACHTTKD